MSFHPLQDWSNKFSLTGPALGMFIVSSSSFLSECCATTGLGWLAVDMEASAATRHDLIHIAQSLNGSTVTLFVRVAQNNQQYIEAALDAGAHGIIIPKISTYQDARDAVNASYYPPVGRRGINPIRCSSYFKHVDDYLSNANSQIFCIPQIETREAVQNIDAIASVKGIRGLFIGCGDLAMDYGTPGHFDNTFMHDARMAVLAACKKYKLIPGIFAYSIASAKMYIRENFKMIGIGNEIQFLRNAIENTILDITAEHL